MALTAGTRIREYEIVGPLGAGGMGEVYRARDTRLNRDVAIKVLPELPVVDGERVARFEREAQTLASLNHPNIAQIHGVVELPDSGSQPGPDGAHGASAFGIVMELVEGEDLAERLRRGAIPLEEALRIGRQIADALDAAHERAVIHRDLKPANVKILDDGTVKLLDFGLAKAVEHGTSPLISATSAATLTSPAVTNIGVILGTAAYMAPEQAKGKPVDRRADIWALGVVLFEMLSGKRVYEGESVTDTIARVITQAPEWDRLPGATPSPIRRVLRRCLEKDPRSRFQSAGDVRVEIDEFLAAPGEPDTARSRLRVPSILPWAVVAILSMLVLAAAWRLWRSSPAPAQPMRLEMRLDGGELEVNADNDGALAVISPDGQTIVYAGSRDSVRRLYVRPLGSLQSTPLSGTESAASQFFSPDGKWIGFFSNGALQKVSVNGGAPVVLVPAPEGRGGAWGEDDTIVFAPSITTGLYRVPAVGGTPIELTTLGQTERSHRWPSLLPEGNAVLFVRQDQGAAYDDGFIEAVRLDTKARKILVRGGTFPRYLPTGHLTYVRENTLFAVPFDAKRLELRGTPQPVLSGVVSSGGVGASFGDGASQIAFSSNGTAAYLAGGTLDVLSRVVIVQRSGKPLFTYPERREFRDPRFSPDGKRIALQMPDERRHHIYVLDLDRAAMTKVTFDGSSNGLPVWSPDGKWLAYYSDRAGSGLNVFLARSDGSSEPQALTSGDGTLLPHSFSPDGKLIAGLKQPFQIFVLSIADKRMMPFAATPAAEMAPAFSPDGKWIAYHSDESGADEVYVRPFPGPGGKWQISAGGGSYPHWTKNGRELVYLSGNQFIAVDVAVSKDALSPGKPQRLFAMPVARPSGATWYDVSANGERFVVLEPEKQTQSSGFTHLTLVFNFADEVRRITGTN